jgi:hypothetical protein
MQPEDGASQSVQEIFTCDAYPVKIIEGMIAADAQVEAEERVRVAMSKCMPQVVAIVVMDNNHEIEIGGVEHRVATIHRLQERGTQGLELAPSLNEVRRSRLHHLMHRC